MLRTSFLAYFGGVGFSQITRKKENNTLKKYNKIPYQFNIFMKTVGERID